MRIITYFRILILFATGTVFILPAGNTVAKGGAAEGLTSEKVIGRLPGRTAAIFTNSTPFIVPSVGNATPYPSDISVTGLSGAITSVKVTIHGLLHQYSLDMGFVLQSPTGASFLIQDGCGVNVNNITYTLADDGTARLPSQEPWPPGTYKPTARFADDIFPLPGPGSTYANPGPVAGGTATFASVFNGSEPNGTWRLFIVDFAQPDGGTINGGWSIEITTTGRPPGRHFVDFNGDGKTDWVVTRNTGGGNNGQVTWFIQENGGSENITYQQWGLLSDDFPVPEDYDGDGKTDIAVFRKTQGAWYILQSQTGTIRAELFGQYLDNPTVVGDYDGDGKADLAVTRVALGGLMYWYYRTTPNGPVFARQWGQNLDQPGPGDYDGDGKFDFVIQRAETFGSPAYYWMNYSSAPQGVLSRLVQFGNFNDFIVPGDYDGDGKTDIAIMRNTGGEYNWYIEPSTAPGTFFGGKWGTPGTDYVTQADYDGDGKTDLAVWRYSGDPSQCFFLVRKSSDGALLFHEWGMQGDYPPANYNQH